MKSMPTGKALLLVQRVLFLHLILQSSIPQNLGVASKVTTLEIEITFFSRIVYSIYKGYLEPPENATVDLGYLWSLGCILYHRLFGSPLCNVDRKQINSLLSVFIYHFFHFFEMFMFLFLAFLALMLIVLAFLAIAKNI